MMTREELLTQIARDLLRGIGFGWRDGRCQPVREMVRKTFKVEKVASEPPNRPPERL